MANGVNPTKVFGSDKLAPRIQQQLDGYSKQDPPTKKKLPVEVDVPECIAAGKTQGFSAKSNKKYRSDSLMAAIGDLCLIAFYFLLQVGEYTVKGSRNQTKQTKQFCLEDATFFRKDEQGKLRQLPRNAPDDMILSADSATLRIQNQKNGWKNVCVNQEANGQSYFCPVKALGRRYVTIRGNSKTPEEAQKTFFSAYFLPGGVRKDVNDNDIRIHLKIAAELLEYLPTRGIPTSSVDTHSLRGGGANALSLAGYSDREIMKMGRWRSATFME